MGHRAFEELPVWRAAHRLALRSFDLIRLGALKGHPGLRDQLERAVVSISNNIAEGYERGTHNELLAFLYYAKGSAGEVRSMLRILEEGEDWREWRPQTKELVDLALSVSRQLWAWLNSLRESTNPGPRHTTEASRAEEASILRQARYMDYLREVQEAAKEGRTPPPFPS